MVHNNNPVFLLRKPYEKISFDKKELGIILSIYGKMVAIGEWRDYGISMLRHRAVFSIFRRTAEFPIFTIEKNPKLGTKNQLYSVVGMDGRILKRGSNIKNVLQVLEKKLIRSVS
jgi:hypothetical protein